MRDDVRDVCRRLGQNVRRRRLEKGLSQEKLANDAGLTDYKHVGQIERGATNPTISYLVGIARALGVDVAELLADPSESRSLSDDENETIERALLIVQRHKRRKR
jgi:transcriptional regulator with XRE-family HTH domain